MWSSSLKTVIDWASVQEAGRQASPSSPTDAIARAAVHTQRTRREGERVREGGTDPQVTCGAVHRVGRQAVGRRLGVHQPGAVVHGLAIRRAGGHQSTLIHAWKAALPVRRESTCVHTLTTHRAPSVLVIILCKGWGYYFSYFLKIIYFLEKEAELLLLSDYLICYVKIPQNINSINRLHVFTCQVFQVMINIEECKQERGNLK